jgi:hypothetical protein
MSQKRLRMVWNVCDTHLCLLLARVPGCGQIVLVLLQAYHLDYTDTVSVLSARPHVRAARFAHFHSRDHMFWSDCFLLVFLTFIVCRQSNELDEF